MMNKKMNFFFVVDLDSGIYREYGKCQAEIAERDAGLRPPAPYNNTYIILALPITSYAKGQEK